MAASPSAAVPPAAPTPDEHRHDRRQRALKSARLVSRDRRSTWDCVIRDLSKAGARIRIENGLFMPAELTLVLISEEIEIPCVVKWRRPGEIGVRFVVEGGGA